MSGFNALLVTGTVAKVTGFEYRLTDLGIEWWDGKHHFILPWTSVVRFEEESDGPAKPMIL